MPGEDPGSRAGGVLRNLAMAYQHEGELEPARFVFDLLTRLEAAVRED